MYFRRSTFHRLQFVCLIHAHIEKKKKKKMVDRLKFHPDKTDQYFQAMESKKSCRIECWMDNNVDKQKMLTK